MRGTGDMIRQVPEQGKNPVGGSRQPPAEGQGAEIRVLLFAQEQTARQSYQDALTICGVRVFITASFFVLSEEICEQTYHGLFLDVSTKMQAIKENQADVYRLAQKFPVAHLRIDRATGAIRCFYFGRQAGGDLQEFIDSQCRSFAPRKIRSVARHEVFLPVLVCRHSGCKRPERTFTKDISPGGCFLVSTRRWKAGKEFFLRFPEFTDTTPIRAQVRTVIEWGKGRQMPGIGVLFRDLSPAQAAEIKEIWRLAERR